MDLNNNQQQSSTAVCQFKAYLFFFNQITLGNQTLLALLEYTSNDFDVTQNEILDDRFIFK